MKKIPYGISSYGTIRQDDCYYVDKTHFIPELEDAGRFLFLIRPRRFGKSSLLTLLESYYDIAGKKQFDFLFNGTHIGENPTPEKNVHLILSFNFSQVNPDLDKIEESFNGHADNRFFVFGKKYREYLDDDYFEMMAKHRQSHQKLEFLLNYVSFKGLKVYVFIDEYDNFTNTILSAEGSEGYHKLTNGAGFFRFFFSILKGATDQPESGIARMFITGVSPVTMDDVTSGFNIGTNISLEPEFNGLLGMTGKDVHDIFEHYKIPDNLAELVSEWYGKYLFAEDADDQMFNPDMILYFTKHYVKSEKPPRNMIDQNVRIDYAKLRHLMILDNRLNGNFGYLEDIVENQGTAAAKIAESFPVSRLAKPSNFISLLYYFGLLSHSRSGNLRVPNQTVRKLLYEYLREGYEDAGMFRLDFWHFGNLIRNMAYKGEWEPVFRFLADEIKKQTSIRDYLNGEKVVQTFFLAYLNVSDFFIVRSEKEMGKGFCDLFMEPFAEKYPDIEYAFLIELKYVSRAGFSEAETEKQLANAREQLSKYARDERVTGGGTKWRIKRLALVFAGWELMEMRLV